MELEVQFNNIDEIALGISLYYGDDESGHFHAVQIGLIIVTIVIYKRIK